MLFPWWPQSRRTLPCWHSGSAVLGRVPGGLQSRAARVLYSGVHRDPQTQRCYQEEDESNYGAQVQNEFSQHLPFYLLTLR